jgi:transcriptional regulator with XRE-family HTH domain
VVYQQQLPMSILHDIGSNIAAERKRLKMTQEDLAGITEIDRTYISEIENGHKNTSILNFVKICKALKVEPNKIIGKISNFEP